MAVIPRDIDPVRSFGDNVWIVTWAALLASTMDVGQPFESPGAADRSAQVFGVFGPGGALAIEGSNDGVNWSVLTDPQGNPLTFQTAKIETITEITRYIRPAIVGGDGTTNLTCVLLVRRGA